MDDDVSYTIFGRLRSAYPVVPPLEVAGALADALTLAGARVTDPTPGMVEALARMRLDDELNAATASVLDG